MSRPFFCLALMGLWLTTANTALAQKYKGAPVGAPPAASKSTLPRTTSKPELIPSAASGKRAIVSQKRDGGKAAVTDVNRREEPKAAEKATPDEPKSPAKLLAWDRLKQAEAEFAEISKLIEVHENRIRTQRSIRIPPGVRPPPIAPVPQELLRIRTGTWNAVQEVFQAYKQTP